MIQNELYLKLPIKMKVNLILAVEWTTAAVEKKTDKKFQA